MRFMLLLKSDARAESDEKPSTEEMEAMMSFYSSMHAAGVVLSAEGLRASKEGARVQFSATESPKDTPGPFTPAESLVCGFWTIKVKDLEEALEWVRKCPLKEDTTIEVRRIAELDDFGENVTEGLRSETERLRRETKESVGTRHPLRAYGGDRTPQRHDSHIGSRVKSRIKKVISIPYFQLFYTF